MASRQQRHDAARNAVSEKFKSWVEEAVAEWDGQDDATICRLIAEKTGHGFWPQAGAAPDLVEACRAALPILSAYIPPDQFDGHAARALVLLRDALAKAQDGG